MSGGMPELGSKISLISKADIRYEGRLFTVDPQECTIALANVRSFGTEERETQLPVAPQNQIYEYILFRGSDIKDIKVVNNVTSIPNDPAIVQMTVQPTMGQPSYQPAPTYGHPMMGPIGPIGGQYGNPYGLTMGAMGPVIGIPGNPRDPRTTMNKQPSELSLGLGEPISIPNTILKANVKPVLKDRSVEDGVLDLIGGGSRSTTPTSSLFTRKSPTMNQGVQVDQQPQPSKKIVDKNMRTVQPPRRDHDSHGAKSGGGGGHQLQSNDGKREVKHDNHPVGPPHLQGPMGGNSMRGNNRGGWIHRGNMRGRGRGRGVYRSNNQPGNTGVKPKNTLKFDNDYDFEQANTEFETLRSQLAKTKIDAGTENEKKDDSGNETGAGEGEQEEDADHITHYDRTKSFFDNISCEAVERSKGRFQRTDWRMERKLNSETFGVSSTRRGGFRGHGYYNRGMGGMYRGHHQMNSNMGYRGGYRGTNRNIPTSNNRKPGQPSQNNIVVGMQNRSHNEPQGSRSQQDNNRLVVGTA